MMSLASNPRRVARRRVLGGLMAAGLCTRPLSGVAAGTWDALRAPGADALMRHALAPGIGDPAGFRLADCATQRNLDAAGREQARAIGASLRDAGIAFERVLTSQWCRCRDTADLLGLGPVTPEPALNSFFRDRAVAGRQTADLRAMLAEKPPAARWMLVTHQVNITALTGQGVSSGEVFVLNRGSGNAISVADRVLIRP